MSAFAAPLPAVRPVLGWLGAAGAAAALLTGAAALAMTVRAPLDPAPLVLDLGREPPAAPALAALAEAAPQVVDEAPDLPAPPAPMAEALPPPAPLAAPEPILPKTQTGLAPPLPEISQRADLALPPPLAPEPPALTPDPAPKPDPGPKPDPTQVAKPQPPEPPVQRPIKTAKAKPANPTKPTKASTAKTAPAQASSAGSSAPKAAAKATGGAASSAATYAKAVMKKVRATSKVAGAGRGRVVVGFTVAESGALAAVLVIRSSGDSGLDQIALSHIRRSAPFPLPPADAGRSFSFEFVGK